MRIKLTSIMVDDQDKALRWAPLFNTDPNQEDWEDAVVQVKKAIREKVLESYHNGQAAGPKRPTSPVRRDVRRYEK